MRKNAKRILSGLLSLALIATTAFTPVHVKAASLTSTLSGKGTASDPFIINKLEDFQQINGAIAKVENSTSGTKTVDVYFSVADNIDGGKHETVNINGSGLKHVQKIIVSGKSKNTKISNVTITPSNKKIELTGDEAGQEYTWATNYQGYFSGLFGKVYALDIDVNNLTFDKCTVDPKTDKEGTYAYNSALVVADIKQSGTSISHTSTIKDITAQNCTIGSTIGGDVTGGFVGFIEGSITQTVKIENCSLKNSKVYAKSLAGGLAGATGGNYSKFKISGTAGESITDKSTVIKTGNKDHQTYAGGIIAYGYASISNLVNEASVTGGYHVGGIMGSNVGGLTNEINNAINKGDVTGISLVGGIIGVNEGTVIGTTLTNQKNPTPTNQGKVTGTTEVGGIAGENNGTIKNIINDGSVIGNDKSHDIGGLVGLNSGTITNASNLSDITGDTNVGGVIGSNKAGLKEGTIDDLKIDGIKNTGKVTGKTNVGGLAGTLDSRTSEVARITGTNEGAVSGTTNVGGIVGDNKGYVSGAENKETGTVNGTTNVGGITGKNEPSMVMGKTVENSGTVVNSKNYAPVNGTNAVGGITGENDTLIDNCTNESTGKVTGNEDVGGIAGLNKGTVKNSTNNADITGVDKDGKTNTDIGGIVGDNRGDVINSNNNGKVTGSDNVGGITGKNDSLVDDCTNKRTGTVTGNEDVGGIAGENNGTIKSSTNEADVNGKTNTGGIAGNNTTTGDIENSNNKGKVTGDTNTGGIAGKNDGKINNSINDGTVKGKTNTGGIAGDNTKTGDITDSINNGNVTGDKNTGGLTGSNEGNVSNSINNGTVTGNKNTSGTNGNNTGTDKDNKNTGSVIDNSKKDPSQPSTPGTPSMPGTPGAITDLTQFITNPAYNTGGETVINYLINPHDSRLDNLLKKYTIVTVGDYTYRIWTNKALGHKSCSVDLYKVANKGLKTIKVADKVQIGSQMFTIRSILPNAAKKYTKATKVIIGKNVKTIGKNAFNGAKNVKTITIKSKKITKINANAFKNCKKLKSIKLKSTKLTRIYANAFSGCKKLKTVTINSKKLKRIDTKAFANCKKLKKVTIKSSKLTKVGAKAFYKTNKKIKINVPNKKIKKYTKVFKKAKLSKKSVIY